MNNKLQARIDELSRLLRQCSVALVSPSGDDEDVTVLAAAVDAPLEDIPALVSDRVSDLECDVFRARARVAQLTAKCDQQQRDIMDLRTELARSTVE